MSGATNDAVHTLNLRSLVTYDSMYFSHLLFLPSLVSHLSNCAWSDRHQGVKYAKANPRSPMLLQQIATTVEGEIAEAKSVWDGGRGRVAMVVRDSVTECCKH